MLPVSNNEIKQKIPIDDANILVSWCYSGSQHQCGRPGAYQKVDHHNMSNNNSKTMLTYFANMPSFPTQRKQGHCAPSAVAGITHDKNLATCVFLQDRLRHCCGFFASQFCFTEIMS